jgi:hypothetical protein
MSRRVHVTCGQVKKLIVANDGTSITEKVRQEFSFSDSFCLQVWDEEFKDFVNVESEVEIIDKSKVNVVISSDSFTVNVNPIAVSSPTVTPSRETSGALCDISSPTSTRQWPVCIQVPLHLFPPDLKKVLDSGCSLSDLKPKHKKQIQEAFFYDMSQYG